ncbi:hypothetical protein JZ751_010372 [Albula glossodonta]|uniref:Uncharacterized protein n=1 Tax=Albula glossodonta TaxID=121402 RepID=A0A8T2NYU9_9TELE|nr:hypothetical protein JZ751_010372 [Albula glossodonta]
MERAGRRTAEREMQITVKIFFRLGIEAASLSALELITCRKRYSHCTLEGAVYTHGHDQLELRRQLLQSHLLLLESPRNAPHNLTA